MYDYRLKEQNQLENTKTPTDIIKNLSFISAVSIAGFSHLNRLNELISSVNRACMDIVDKERSKLEDITPLFTTDYTKTWRIPQPDVISHIIERPEILSYEVWREDSDLFSLDDFIPVEDTTSPDKDPIIKQFLEEEKDEIKKLSKEVIEESGKSLRRLEDSYRGLTAILAENDIKIDYVKEISNINKRSYDIVIRNITSGKATTISLPMHEMGVIKHGNIQWLFRPTAVKVTQGAIITERFDRSFFNYLRPALKRMSNVVGDTDKVDLIKRHINNSLGNMFQSRGITLNSNEFLGLQGMPFIRGEGSEYLGKLFDKDKSAEFLKLNPAYEGVRIYSLDPIGKIEDTPFIASVTGGSETALTTSGAGWSTPRVGMGVLPDYYKQSTFRQNISKGYAVKRGRTDWSIRFGAIASDLLDKISDIEIEDYPGRMSSVGFYFSPGKTISDGAMAYVHQFEDGVPLAADFNSRYSKSHIISLMPGEGSTFKLPPSSAELYERFKNKETVIVRKGQVLGINPADNSLIRADKTGVIKEFNIGSRKDKAKIVIESSNYIGYGTKEVYTKEVIEHSLTNNNISTIFMENDQKVAEYISRFNGKKGVEYLLNGSSMKRFMNGGVGMGFITKVLSDVGSVFKEKLSDPSISYAESLRLKKQIKEFSRSFIETQLGEKTNQAIKEIHIDDLGGVGLEYHKGVDPSSEIFHRTIEIDNLVKKGNSTGNWEPFLARMKEVEKYVNDNAIGGGYQVVGYAQSIADLSRKDPVNMAAFIMSGDQAKPGNLIFANLKLLMATHSVNDTNLSSVATFERTKNGFIGGSKLTMEMRRNYENLGLYNMANYMDNLMDYRMGYILNKYKNDKIFLLKSKDVAKNGYTVTLGNRKIDVKITTFLEDNPSDIRGRINTMIANDEMSSIYKSFRVAQDNLSNIQGMTDFDINHILEKGGLLSIDDLHTMGKLGIGGNSIGIVEAELFKELRELINTSGRPGETMYMKLPFEISFADHYKGDLVSMINFDRDDTFSLLAYKDVAGTGPGKQYVATSPMQLEQLRYIQKVSNLVEEYNTVKSTSKRAKDIRSEVETEVNSFHSRLTSHTGSKKSKWVKSIVETKAPFSVRGELKGVIDLPAGTLGMTPDGLVRTLTGNKTKTYRELENKIKLFDNIKFIDSFRSIDTDLIVESEKNLKMYRYKLSKMVGGRRHSILKKLTKMVSGRTYEGLIDEELDIYSMSKTVSEIFNLTDNLEHAQKAEKAILRSHKRLTTQIDSIFKLFNEEDILNLSAYNKVTEMINEKTPLYVIGERYPIIGISAGMSARLEIYTPDIIKNKKKLIKDSIESAKLSNDGIITTKTYNSIIERINAEIERANNYIFVKDIDATRFRADFDKDFMQIVVTSLDTIKNTYEQSANLLNIDITKLDKKEIYELLSKRGSSGMVEDTILDYVRRKSVVYNQYKIGITKLRPANASSSMMIDVIKKAEYIDSRDPVKIIELKDAVKNEIESAFPNESKLRKKTIFDSIMNRIGDSQYKIDPKHGRVVVIEDINYLKDNPVMDLKIHKDHTDSPRYIPGKMTEEQAKLYNEILTDNKESFIDYKRKMINESSERYGEMKKDTFKAYKMGTAINRLAENLAVPEIQKEFMYHFASEILAQNTIDIKHGTPSYIHFFEEVIKSLEDSKYDPLLKTDLLKRLESGNFILDIPGHVEQIKKYGLIEKVTDEIDFDKYQEYLNIRKEIGDTLYNAHNLAQEKLDTLIQSGEKDKNILIREKRAIIDSHMENYKISSNIKVQPFKTYGVQEWMYGINEVNTYMINSQLEIDNAAKTRVGLKFNRGNIGQLTRDLKMHMEKTGHSILRDPLELATTKFSMEFGGETAGEILSEIINKIEREPLYKSPHSLNQTFARVAAATLDKEVKVIKRSKDYDNTIRDSLRKKEKSAIARKVGKDRANAPTIFYRGSMIDGLSGKSQMMARRTPESIRIARAEGALKAKATLAGALAGILLAQSVNMLTGEYAVPGLSNQRGLGGEYYERHGIIGKEMEVFLRDRPVKVISETSYWKREKSIQEGLMNLSNSQIRYNTQKHESQYQGVVVR